MIERKTGRACRVRRILAAGSTLLMTALASMVTIAVTDAARADDNNAYGHNKWYVSASAAAGGNGSAAAPFNTLAQVQQASGPGDKIIVVPSPVSIPPLDGGIALKAGQRLIGGGPPVVKFGAPLVSGGPPVVGASNLSSLPRITNTTAAGRITADPGHQFASFSGMSCSAWVPDVTEILSCFNSLLAVATVVSTDR